MPDEHQINPQSSEESNESTLSFQEVEKVELNAARTTVSDALNYLYSVKVAFGGNSEEYHGFCDLMLDLKALRITTSGVISRVKVLFVNHPELLEGLNPFLPAGYKISVPCSSKSGFDFEEAMRFVNRVKEAFPHDKVCYASFLKLLNGYHNANTNIAEFDRKGCYCY